MLNAFKVMAQRTMVADAQLKLKTTFHFSKQTKRTLCPNIFHAAFFEDRDIWEIL